MQFLKLPSMRTLDEHIFYVLEGATLQVFGEESYPVFLAASAEHRLHSLAHTAVSDFSIYAVTETARETQRALTEWDAGERQTAMLQVLGVRRCLFAPIYEMLSDTCRTLVDGAIAEHRTPAGDALYRDTVQRLLNERFTELAMDADFVPYLQQNEMTHALQVRNLAKLFHHCEAFASTNGVDLVMPNDASTRSRCAYITQQFQFLTTIVSDYLTRDLRVANLTEVTHGDAPARIV